MRKFTTVLDAMSVEYYIGGSIASIVFGVARTTRDIDFVVTLSTTKAGELVHRLKEHFYIDQVAVERAIIEGDCFNALELEKLFQVDVFTPKGSPWVREQFSRRRLNRFAVGADSLDVYLCSPEDVVLNKLFWFKMGNEVSRLQWDDALGVLTVQRGRLDEEYLRRWVAELGIVELWERARSQTS